MDPRFALGVGAGILSFVAYLLYISSTAWGKTRPNRVTWWVLTLVGIMIASSYYAEGARNTIWIALAYVAGPLIVAIAAFWKGEGGASKFDLYCLAGVVISFIIWLLTGSALTALLLNLLIDLLGLLPTIKKSYLRPEGEDTRAWALETLASFISLLAIPQPTFSILVYPLYLFLMNGTITFVLFTPRKYSNQ